MESKDDQMESDLCPCDQASPSHTQFLVSVPDGGASAAAQANKQTVTGLPGSVVEDLDSFNLIEPPPLDWKSDCSSEVDSAGELDDPEFPPTVERLHEVRSDESVLPPLNGSEAFTPLIVNQQEEVAACDRVQDQSESVQDQSESVQDQSESVQDQSQSVQDQSESVQDQSESVLDPEVEVQDAALEEEQEVVSLNEAEDRVTEELDAVTDSRPGDEDHTRIQALLSQLQLMSEEPRPRCRTPPDLSRHHQMEPSAHSLRTDASTETTALLFSETHQRDVLGLLQCTEIGPSPPPAACPPHRGEMDAVVAVSYSEADAQRYWGHCGNGQQLQHRDESFSSLPDDEDDEYPEPVWMKMGEEPPEEKSVAESESEQRPGDRPAYKDVPGPCDPDDLLEGVIFGAKYLGSTQIKSEKNPSTNARMAQAQEAVDRIKAPDDETQPMTEVDLFISTQRIKVLTADTQEAMMDHQLQMISYIADIAEIVVLMVRRKQTSNKGQDGERTANSSSSSSLGPQKKCLMICHVFSSTDAQVIAQAIGQAFGVAYQQFLQTNGIKASQLRPGDYSDYLGSQELYNGDLAHFSDSQNIRDVTITKAAGEILGLAVVESGWGSILPTVVVANLLHGGPAECCGELSIGDRIMSINGTSLVGLPIATCQTIIRDLKNQKCLKLSIVHCPPVTMAIIRRPDPKFQLGFSVEDGIICSLMRGGIAERGGIRVGHRIIEINGQSVVATPHDKIIQILTNAVGEIHLKTMPASTYRLLTGQEQPLFL
ncbi:amyloid-beta A4 precursor protein-binding family A member 3 [Genypterus blacodes]|uniref:amyloid-beta A4 precursor protein-binding family A member 3 n=1 Tax=Genypterus blacodes TaxID=154954 RepID=UPI003F775EA0